MANEIGPAAGRSCSCFSRWSKSRVFCHPLSPGDSKVRCAGRLSLGDWLAKQVLHAWGAGASDRRAPGLISMNQPRSAAFFTHFVGEKIRFHLPYCSNEPGFESALRRPSHQNRATHNFRFETPTLMCFTTHQHLEVFRG